MSQKKPFESFVGLDESPPVHECPAPPDLRQPDPAGRLRGNSSVDHLPLAARFIN